MVLTFHFAFFYKIFTNPKEHKKNKENVMCFTWSSNYQIYSTILLNPSKFFSVNIF